MVYVWCVHIISVSEKLHMIGIVRKNNVSFHICPFVHSYIVQQTHTHTHTRAQKRQQFHNTSMYSFGLKIIFKC